MQVSHSHKCLQVYYLKTREFYKNSEMAGKKGGKEKKAGDAKDKLPPPPNLDQTRQGALEALLQFK